MTTVLSRPRSIHGSRTTPARHVAGAKTRLRSPQEKTPNKPPQFNRPVGCHLLVREWVPHVDMVGQTPSASPSLAELRGSL